MIQPEQLPHSPLEANSFLTPGKLESLQVGNVEDALASSEHIIEGAIETPRQEHFYEETYSNLCIPGENGEMNVYRHGQFRFWHSLPN